MSNSYPDKPAGWTLSQGPPERDRHLPLAGHTNPVSEDLRLAEFHADGILARFAGDIGAADTGVMLSKHATRNHNQNFDPKIDAMVVLKKNIKQIQLARYPDMRRDNIVGS